MSIFSLTARKKPKLFAVVDIGSHLIRALIFEERVRDSAPRVIKKMVIKLPASYDKERIFNRLRELMFAMVKELERIPEKITVALGPHLVEHSFRVWTVTNLDIYKKITRQELNSYFRNLFEENKGKEFSALAYPLGLLINGYPVNIKDIESRAKSLIVLPARINIGFKVLFLVFTREVGKILSDMKASLGGMPIEFIPLVAATQEALTKTLGIKDGFLVDVGGEETTLIYLKDGEICETVKFSLGARHFLRGITRIAAISFEEAEDVKRQYVQGMLSESKKQELNDFFRKEAELWQKMFLEALDSFYHIGPIPPKILLFGGGAYLPEIAGILRDPSWFKNFSSFDAAELKILEAENLFEGNTCNGFIKGPADVGLASLIAYSTKHEPVF